MTQSPSGLFGLRWCARPVLVPTQVRPEQAKELFDRKLARIYVVPRNSAIRPEDYTARAHYSFHRDNWHRFVMLKAEADRTIANCFHDARDHILRFASRQSPLNPAMMSRALVYYLDFYHFVAPEIQVVRSFGPVPEDQAYELRQGVEPNRYFMLHYVPAADYDKAAALAAGNAEEVFRSRQDPTAPKLKPRSRRRARSATTRPSRAKRNASGA